MGDPIYPVSARLEIQVGSTTYKTATNPITVGTAQLFNVYLYGQDPAPGFLLRITFDSPEHGYSFPVDGTFGGTGGTLLEPWQDFTPGNCTICGYIYPDYDPITHTLGAPVESSPSCYVVNFVEPNTPVGSPIQVNLPSAIITFPSITGEGVTVDTLDAAPCGSLPSGFISRGSTHHITSTATYTGPVTVGIRYNDAGIPTEDDMRLFHCDGSGWHDVTTSVDTVNNIIYGQDSTLSWWLIGDPPGPSGGGGGATGVPVFPNIYIGIAAALGAGVLAYFVRRRRFIVRR
jgi:hypothetical protein